MIEEISFSDLPYLIEQKIDNKAMPEIRKLLLEYSCQLMTAEIRKEMEEKFSEIVRLTLC